MVCMCMCVAKALPILWYCTRRKIKELLKTHTSWVNWFLVVFTQIWSSGKGFWLYYIYLFTHLPSLPPFVFTWIKRKKNKSIEIYIYKGCAKLKRREMYDNWRSLCLSEDNHEWFSFPMSYKVHYKRLLRKINMYKINGKACELEIV